MSCAQRKFRSTPQAQISRQFKSPLCKNPNAETQSPTEAHLSERLKSLQNKIKEADKELEELKASGYKEAELQTHIDKLHEYNEIKDIGQMVLGRIADIEGLQTKDLYSRYELDLKD